MKFCGISIKAFFAVGGGLGAGFDAVFAEEAEGVAVAGVVDVFDAFEVEDFVAGDVVGAHEHVA